MYVNIIIINFKMFYINYFYFKKKISSNYYLWLLNKYIDLLNLH